MGAGLDGLDAPVAAPRQPVPGAGRVVAVVAVAFVVLVAAIVIGVFTRSANQGRSAGAEGVAQRYVHALATHEVSELAALSCSGTAGAVATALAPQVSAASVQHVFVTGNTGRAQLEITATVRVAASTSGLTTAPASGPAPASRTTTATFPGTLELSRSDEDWCVREFHDQPPTF